MMDCIVIATLSLYILAYSASENIKYGDSDEVKVDHK